MYLWACWDKEVFWQKQNVDKHVECRYSWISGVTEVFQVFTKAKNDRSYLIGRPDQPEDVHLRIRLHIITEQGVKVRDGRKSAVLISYTVQVPGGEKRKKKWEFQDKFVCPPFWGLPAYSHILVITCRIL